MGEAEPRQAVIGRTPSQSPLDADPNDSRPRAPNLVRALAWSLTGNLMSKAGIVVFTLLAAAALDAEDFGQFVGLQAVALMAAVAWDLGLTTVVTREIAAGHVDLGSASRRILQLRLETGPIGVLTFALGIWLLGRNIELDAAVVALMAILAVLVGVQVLVNAALVGWFDFRSAGVATALGRWIAVLGPAMALLWPGRSLLLLAGALCLSEVVAIALGSWRLRRTGPGPSTERIPAAGVLSHRAALPFAANSVLQMAYNRFDVLIVAAIASAGVVAAYAPASRIQDALLLFAATAGPVALPMLARLHAQETGSASQSRVTWARITLVAVMASIGLALITWLAAPVLVPALLGETYREAVGPIRIIVWSVPLIAFNSVLAAAVIARGRPYYVTLAIGAAGITAGVLVLTLVPSLGADGAAIGATLREVPVGLVLLFGAYRSGLFRLGPGQVREGSARGRAMR